jgi:hypothetical protein
VTWWKPVAWYLIALLAWPLAIVWAVGWVAYRVFWKDLPGKDDEW